MATNDLLKLKDFKDWRGITTQTDDGVLSDLISELSQEFYGEIYRPQTVFALTDYSETRDGNGSDRMLVEGYPINSVASVTISGDALSASDGTSLGYLFDSDGVSLIGTTFTVGRLNVTIAYNGGLNGVPLDVVRWAKETIAYRYLARKNTRLKSVASKTGETTTFDLSAAPISAAQIAERYKRRFPL